MNRKREQAEIFFKIGQLLGPLLKIFEHPGSYDADERTRIVARFFAEVNDFRIAYESFTKGEPGHDYQLQYYQVVNMLGHLVNIGDITSPSFPLTLANLRKTLLDATASIPVPIESAIHESHTPFSTYCLVHDLCSTSMTKIVWMDRYFDLTIFGRYFTNTPKSALITLITYPETKCTSTRDRQRYADFLGVSRLFAQERGTSGYRLVTGEQFHDRWLMCDDKLFALGGSIKDLGNDTTFTLSKLDSSPDNRKHVDDAIQSGVELFGENQPVHP